MKKNLYIPEPTYEFHIAKKIREKYELDESFFSLRGNVVFANFYQVRVFVQKVNDKRAPENHISPGEINGAGLLDEIYHIAIRNYIKNIFPNAFPSALANLKFNLGENNFDKLFLEFIRVFPPKKVYTKELTEKEYLNGYTESIPNREILLEELILLYLENKNPAFQRIKEFFDENYLNQKTSYRAAISTLKEFFNNDDLKIGITSTDMFDFLSRPFYTHSGSIWEQLEYIKNEWGIFIDKNLLMKIQSSKDLFTESIKFEPTFGGGGGAPTIVPKYKGQQIDASHLVIGKSNYRYAEDSTKDYEEFEHFTPDVNWMPNLILMAKNIYVWLDQLSKKYKTEINTLDKIPIEELRELKQRNINGLWLIGVWERSPASKKIKHIMGNIDAVASAYSLFDYQIAHDLGGEYAYHVFNENARKNGIRLASDMVPNHTGIFSKWTLEHPEYFIQSDHPPFPNYRFTGENLSEHPDIEIRIEDQYWSQQDAAVVFERKDLRNGETKYIYHGNDGTAMPWNDTAQLNLLKEEVREELIQKIFEVARKFSVIRFDAAMTLAKKHYSRLWFPEPGKGGDIPSRSDHALTRRQFDELFPKEFWREVVDRINEEMPETLLLAEAFWLMEGYFVRTLGMHRVYNSAFMNMMMNEENQKYRELITNTLEFEPEILKRYVNFMSNPDEETAIDQFGDGDKYFGVLILMCTLPGLPMFAHGQIEGYKEKYGMEYKRAYYDEYPTQWLVERHEKEIFPVLRKRHIFSEVTNFWIYDFLDYHGNVNENVFIYSNEVNEEKGLVIFNNKYESVSGSFYFSRQKLNGNSTSTAELSNINIASKFEIRNSDFHFYIFRDITNGLEYLYNGSELHNNGMYLELDGYEHRVILHYEELFDPTGDTYRFYKENYGKGIYNIRKELQKIQLAPVHEAYKNLFDNEFFEKFNSLKNAKKYKNKKTPEFLEDVTEKFNVLITTISEQYSVSKNYKSVVKAFTSELDYIIKTKYEIVAELEKKKLKTNIPVKTLLTRELRCNWLTIILFKSIIVLKELFTDNEELKENYINELMLTRPIKSLIRENVNEEGDVCPQILMLDILLQFDEKALNVTKLPSEFLKLRSGKKLYEYFLYKNFATVSELFEKDLFKSYLEVNTYEGLTYYSKERFEDFCDLLNLWYLFKYEKNLKTKKLSKVKQKTELIRIAKKLSLMNIYLKNHSELSEYLYDNLLVELALKD